MSNPDVTTTIFIGWLQREIPGHFKIEANKDLANDGRPMHSWAGYCSILGVPGPESLSLCVEALSIANGGAAYSPQSIK